MNKGKLYLIPSPLGDYDPAEVIPAGTLEVLKGLKTFVVEETRTARRYLSAAGLKGHIAELEFHELNEHTAQAEVEALAGLFDKGDVGLISEAGLPAVADPGAALVALCHRHGIAVVPLVGPSSLMLALMGSGLDGQSFAFRGYLPAKTDEPLREGLLRPASDTDIHRNALPERFPPEGPAGAALPYHETLPGSRHHPSGRVH